VITSLLSGELSERLRQSQLRYAESSDYEVVSRAQHGEESASEYLLYKYRNLVRSPKSALPATSLRLSRQRPARNKCRSTRHSPWSPHRTIRCPTGT
jgi:hypothetical protein